MFTGFSLNPQRIKRVSGSGKSGLRAGGRVGRKTGELITFTSNFLKKMFPCKKKNLPIQKIKFLPVKTNFATRAKKPKKCLCKKKWACKKRKISKKVGEQIKKLLRKIRKNGQKWIAWGRKKILLIQRYRIFFYSWKRLLSCHFRSKSSE